MSSWGKPFQGSNAINKTVSNQFINQNNHTNTYKSIIKDSQGSHYNQMRTQSYITQQNYNKNLYGIIYDFFDYLTHQKYEPAQNYVVINLDYNDKLRNKILKVLEQLKKINNENQSMKASSEIQKNKIHFYEKILNCIDDSLTLNNQILSGHKSNTLSEEIKDKIVKHVQRLNEFEELKKTTKLNDPLRWLRLFMSIIGNEFSQQKVSFMLESAANQIPASKQLSDTLKGIRTYCERFRKICDQRQKQKYKLTGRTLNIQNKFKSNKLQQQQPSLTSLQRQRQKFNKQLQQKTQCLKLEINRKFMMFRANCQFQLSNGVRMYCFTQQKYDKLKLQMVEQVDKKLLSTQTHSNQSSLSSSRTSIYEEERNNTNQQINEIDYSGIKAKDDNNMIKNIFGNYNVQNKYLSQEYEQTIRINNKTFTAGEVGKLIEDYNKIINELTVLKQCYQTNLQQISGLKKQIQTLNKNINQSQTQCNIMRQQNSSLKLKQNKYQKQIKELKQQQTNLYSALRIQQEKNNNNLRLVQRLNKDIKAKEDKITALNNQLKLYEESNQSTHSYLQNKITELTSMIDSQKKTSDDLRQQITKRDQLIQQKDNQLYSKQIEILGLNVRLKEIQAQLQQANNRLKQGQQLKKMEQEDRQKQVVVRQQQKNTNIQNQPTQQQQQQQQQQNQHQHQQLQYQNLNRHQSQDEPNKQSNPVANNLFSQRVSETKQTINILPTQQPKKPNFRGFKGASVAKPSSAQSVNKQIETKQQQTGLNPLSQTSLVINSKPAQQQDKLGFNLTNQKSVKVLTTIGQSIAESNKEHKGELKLQLRVYDYKIREQKKKQEKSTQEGVNLSSIKMEPTEIQQLNQSAQVEQLKQTCERQKQQIQLKNQELEMKKKEIQQLNKDYDEVTQHSQKAKQQLSVKLIQISNLKQKLQKEQQLTQELKQQIKRLNQQIGIISNSRKSSSEQSKTYQNDKITTEEQINQENAQLIQLMQTCQKQKKQIQSRQEEINKLIKQKDQLRVQNRNYFNQIQGLTFKLKKQKKEKEALSNQFNSLKQQIQTENNFDTSFELQPLSDPHRGSLSNSRVQGRLSHSKSVHQLLDNQNQRSTCPSKNQNEFVMMHYQKLMKDIEDGQKLTKQKDKEIKDLNNEISKLRINLQEKDGQLKSLNDKVSFIKLTMRQLSDTI